MANTKRNRHRKLRKPVKVILSFVLILTITVGGTLAYLSTRTDDVVNTFTPSHVDCTVVEVFENNIKSSIRVQNTSDIDAFIRVKLISYRVNEAGEQIGGTAPITGLNPGLNLSNDWFEKDGFYYHKAPVAADDNNSDTFADMTKDLLENGSEIELTGSYNDPDGGKQVIEVMAEAIQSKPNTAVEQAWGVTVGEDGNLIDPSTLTEGGN
ncbi:MAG: hypothetical protein ACI32N_02785 [Bulleidia sp.]